MTAQDLKNSVLQLAVQGKLVAQNPDDEPAAVLLEKIRAEKKRLVKEGKIKADKTESVIFKGDDGLFYEDVGGNILCIDEEIPFEIPESWVWCRLNALCDVTGGYAFKSTDFENNGMRVIRISDFDENGFKCHRIVRHKYNEKLAPYKLEKYNILMAMTGGTVGKSYFVEEIPEEMVVNQRVATIKINEILCNAYINSVITAPVTQQVIQAAKNSTNDNISMDDIKSFLIPLPPFSEQQRIVEMINELQPMIDAYGKAERELTILNNRFPDDLKKSILQYTVQGKLVEQNPEDEPAAVLLEKIKAEKARLVKEKKIKVDKVSSSIYKGEDGSYYENSGGEIKCIDEEIPFEIPESWVWCRLIDCCNDIADIDHKMPLVEENGYPYISPTNFTNDNGIDYVNAKKVSKNDFLNLSKKVKPERDDIIFPRYGTIGVIRLINTDIDFLVSYSCATIKTSKINSLPKYLFYALQSQATKNEIAKYINKTTQPNVGLQSIKQFLFPLPPISEQKRIVAKVEELLKLCDKLN